ncbi:hypothetical protein [Desulfoferula mesophila]|uniref:hypothetical protein n=1 Tax=Desulfoferula mesophila TaxID=3058419 RepID=UPI0030D3E58C
MRISIVLFVILLVVPSAAHAYVDPGTGGMIYQIIILLGAAVSGVITIFRKKIMAFFRSRGKR